MAVALVCVVYQYVYVSLVGIAAAIAIPIEFFEFFGDHKTLALVAVSFMTTIPAAAMAAGIGGVLLVSVVKEKRLLWSALVVIASTLYTAFQSVDYISATHSLMYLLIPQYAFAVPGWIAWWCFLPIAVFLLQRFWLNRTEANPPNSLTASHDL